MKKIITFLFVILTVLWAFPVFGQANRQTITRLRGANNNLANIAAVRALTLTYPVTTWGLHTNSSTYFYDGATFRWWLGATVSDAMPAAPLAPYVIALGTYYDGTNYRRLLGGDMADNLAAAQTLPWVGAYNLFYDGTNHRRWLGAQANSDAVPTTTVSPWVGSFNMFYDETNADWSRDTGDAMDSDAVATTSEAPRRAAFGHIYRTDGDVWARDAGETADGGDIAATVGAAYRFTLNYGWNGATWSPGLIGAVGEWQMTDVAVRPGESAGDDWRKGKKEDTAVYLPGEIGPTTVDDTVGGIIVYPSTYVGNSPNWTFWITNEGGGSADDFLLVWAEASPNGTDGWVDLTAAESPLEVEADTLSPTESGIAMMGSNASLPYVRLRAICAGGEDTTASADLSANKN